MISRTKKEGRCNITANVSTFDKSRNDKVFVIDIPYKNLGWESWTEKGRSLANVDNDMQVSESKLQKKAPRN